LNHAVYIYIFVLHLLARLREEATEGLLAYLKKMINFVLKKKLLSDAFHTQFFHQLQI
jgi:hypothetical protein